MDLYMNEKYADEDFNKAVEKTISKMQVKHKENIFDYYGLYSISDLLAMEELPEEIEVEDIHYKYNKKLNNYYPIDSDWGGEYVEDESEECKEFILDIFSEVELFEAMDFEALRKKCITVINPGKLTNLEKDLIKSIKAMNNRITIIQKTGSINEDTVIELSSNNHFYGQISFEEECFKNLRNDISYNISNLLDK